METQPLDTYYDPADLAGQQVTLGVQGPIKISELYPLLETETILR